MSREKKKFKDTKVGKFLSEKAPGVLDVVDDYFPPAKLITAAVNAITGNGLSSEDQLKLDTLLLDYEQNERKDFIADRQSARTREVGFLQAVGHVDWMMYFVCIVGLAAFGFILYTLVYITIPEENRDLFIHAIGMVEGVAVSIFSYYFGSSKGSTEKTKMLNR